MPVQMLRGADWFTRTRPAAAQTATNRVPAPGQGAEETVVWRLAARDVLDPLLARGDPGHHGPQLGADHLDRVRLALLAQLAVAGPARVRLGDPFVGELAGADLVEDRPHLGAHRVVDDPRAPGEV